MSRLGCEMRTAPTVDAAAEGMAIFACDTDAMAPASRLLSLDDLPGFRYRDDFLTAPEESALLEAIEAMTFAAFEMRGVVAKRRVAFFGESYDRGRAEPIPGALLPLRDRVAAWAGVPAHAFAMALVNEYPAGAPIGWHRDAPQYDIVSGVSLLSDCRMRFRPYVSPAEAARTPAPRRAWPRPRRPACCRYLRGSPAADRR